MKRSLALLAILAILMPSLAAAQKKRAPIRLIRDTEIENTIRAYSVPVFKAAGLGTGTVEVHIVNDNRLNAFVAGGRHMFINTGLLMRANNAGQVIGVVAHETGHIVGGHLVRLRDQIREAQIKQIIALLIGVGAGIASGNPKATIGAAGLGAQIARGDFLKYTRTQEAAADQFAVDILDQIRVSSRGLMEFLQILSGQDALISTNQDPYIRSHPLTARRISFIRGHLSRSRYANAKMPSRIRIMHQRMRAKLIGFLQPPQQVHTFYKGRESSMEARYANAVAYHRDAELAKALTLIDGLIKEQPRDPYFHELKGQILFESGRIPGAVASYTKAVRFLPDAPLIRASLGQAQLAMNTPGHNRAALVNLRRAVSRDRNNAGGWRMLGIAYGRLGNIGMASLALAEYSLLINDQRTARAQIARAEKGLKRGSPGWLRAQDLKAVLKEIKRRSGRR